MTLSERMHDLFAVIDHDTSADRHPSIAALSSLALELAARDHVMAGRIDALEQYAADLERRLDNHLDLWKGGHPQ